MVLYKWLQLIVDVERTTKSISKLNKSQQQILCYMAGASKHPKDWSIGKNPTLGNFVLFVAKAVIPKSIFFSNCQHTEEARQKYKGFLEESFDWSEIIFYITHVHYIRWRKYFE